MNYSNNILSNIIDEDLKDQKVLLEQFIPLVINLFEEYIISKFYDLSDMKLDLNTVIDENTIDAIKDNFDEVFNKYIIEGISKLKVNTINDVETKYNEEIMNIFKNLKNKIDYIIDQNKRNLSSDVNTSDVIGVMKRKLIMLKIYMLIRTELNETIKDLVIKFSEYDSNVLLITNIQSRNLVKEYLSDNLSKAKKELGRKDINFDKILGQVKQNENLIKNTLPDKNAKKYKNFIKTNNNQKGGFSKKINLENIINNKYFKNKTKNDLLNIAKKWGIKKLNEKIKSKNDLINFLKIIYIYKNTKYFKNKKELLEISNIMNLKKKNYKKDIIIEINKNLKKKIIIINIKIDINEYKY